MKKNRAYYQKLFQDYPDLVTQAQLRQMLNGISISFSSRLIHEKRVQSFFIRPSYAIEAMGTQYGVVRTKVEGRGWQGWCKIPYIQYDD